MKTVLAAMSAAIAIMASVEGNYFLMIYWLSVMLYWLINRQK